MARATDIKGSVGQSLPLSYTGDPPPAPDEVFVTSFYDPWMPIEAFAEEFHVGPENIIDLNPESLGRWARRRSGYYPINTDAEQIVAIRIRNPPPEIAVGSKASGKICYPSQKIPAMTAYFQNTKTKKVTTLPIKADQLTYSVNLLPGTYTAYAWLPDKSLSGSYSKAVPCGLSVSCTDHTLLPFTVQTGSTTSGIDICDWYSIPVLQLHPRPLEDRPDQYPLQYLYLKVSQCCRLIKWNLQEITAVYHGQY